MAVSGRAAGRAVGFSDLTDDGAQDEAVRRLQRLGVDRALARAGARDGDEVQVGDMSFTWYRDQMSGGLDPDARPPRRTRRTRRGDGPTVARSAAQPTDLPEAERRTLVVKIGSSSLTTGAGLVDGDLIGRLAAEIAGLRRAGHRVVVVTSGAIAVGWAALGSVGTAPDDPGVLQAVSAVGQPRLMRSWQDGLAEHGLLAGQVLLAPLDFMHRQQYLHARGTFRTCWSSASSRWSTRTTPWPTRRSASATTTGWPPWSPTWSGPTCSSC